MLREDLERVDKSIQVELDQPHLEADDVPVAQEHARDAEGLASEVEGLPEVRPAALRISTRPQCLGGPFTRLAVARGDQEQLYESCR